MPRNVALGCCLALVLFVHPTAAPVSAEFAYFASGRVISIAGHRVEGETIVRTLRGGGEVVCDSSLIDRIELDTRPVPPPRPATPPSGETASAAPQAIR